MTRIARTLTFTWLIAATLIPAKDGAGQTEKSQGGTMMDYGLTQPQAAEVLTHLAFYTGWPSVFSALPVAKDVFEKRGR